jgi:exodeoxyribonuclease-3
MIQKIATWNVNGLRAVLSKNGMDWLDGEPVDVLCMQEIKTRPEQIPEERLGCFHGYRAFWNPGDRPGYSGVATLCAQEPENVQYGLGNSFFDSEGRVLITRHPGFLLFNIYFPNGQRDQERLTFKLDFYAYLLDLCDRLHASGENIVITGDFNTAHREIDLKNPKANAKTSGFLPEERAWLDRYLEHGFLDAFRVLYPDRIQYTWWTYRMGARERNIGWRLDYYLVSPALMPKVRDVRILEHIHGSDHCPVVLELDT